MRKAPIGRNDSKPYTELVIVSADDPLSTAKPAAVGILRDSRPFRVHFYTCVCMCMCIYIYMYTRANTYPN